MLFAFCGKRQAVESLCAGSLAVLPAPTRAFWLATADLQAGASESAKQQFEELLPGADPLLRGAIERRLSRISILSEPLDATAERVIEEAATEHGHEERFRGWLRENALAAKRRLILMLFIVLMEVLFDSVIPQVSMTAHLSGAFIGFAAAMVLHDRLRTPAPRQPALKS